jgi:hypothetical protein
VIDDDYFYLVFGGDELGLLIATARVTARAKARTKCGGLSTERRTVKLSDASVEMTDVRVGVGKEQAKAGATARAKFEGRFGALWSAYGWCR